MLDPVLNDAVTSPLGEGYRLIDFDKNLKPYVRCIALTGQDEMSNDFFIVYSARNLLTEEEGLFYKNTSWNKIPDIGYSSPGNIEAQNNESLHKLLYRYYPNPVKDELIIELNKAYEKDYLRIEFYSIHGGVLDSQEGNMNDINLSIKRFFKNISTTNMIMMRLISLTSKVSESRMIVRE